MKDATHVIEIWVRDVPGEPLQVCQPRSDVWTPAWKDEEEYQRIRRDARPLYASRDNLPPVGSTQTMVEDGREVTVLAHGISLGAEVAICQDGDRLTMALPAAFRTEGLEQAEQDMFSVLDEVKGQGATSAQDWAVMVAQAMVAKGWRK